MKHLATLQTAIRLHRGGLLDAAESAYKKALRAAPHDVDAMNRLAMLMRQKGDKAEALKLLAKALAVRPAPILFVNKSVLLAESGRLEEAVEACLGALALEPSLAEARSRLCGLLLELRQYPEALVCYGRLLALTPNDATAYPNIGNALRRLNETGEAEEAEKLITAIAAHESDSAVENLNLGRLLGQNGRQEDAIARLERALLANPSLHVAREDIITLLIANARYQEAFEHCQAFVDQNPRYFNAPYLYATLLTKVGEADEAIPFYREAVALKPGLPPIRSGLLLALNYAAGPTAEAVFRDHVAFDEAYCRRLGPQAPWRPSSADPEKILNIGYLSGDFREHAVAYFLDPIVSRIDHRSFRAFAYNTAGLSDRSTEQLKARFDAWRDVAEIDDNALAALIRDDGIDILVDLSGHTARNRFLAIARKPAPIQVTWLGYPNTSGLSTMDYRLTDSFAEPEGMTEHLNTERLFRLPEVFCCYTPCAVSPARAVSERLRVRRSPALETGHVTFGSFNNIAKLTPPVVELWSMLLRGLPSAKLMLEASGLGSEFMRERVGRRFATHGIGPERLILVERKPEHQYALYHRIDIALDPFPCNGGTTSFDALWMGVPLVTLAGKTFVSRMGVSFLSNLGLEYLIAGDEVEYVEIGKRLAGDVESLDRLRLGLRERMEASPLMDADRFVRNLEAAYRDMWRHWCGGSSQERAAV